MVFRLRLGYRYGQELIGNGLNSIANDLATGLNLHLTLNLDLSLNLLLALLPQFLFKTLGCHPESQSRHPGQYQGFSPEK